MVDNGPIREQGIEFDIDWRALVREVIAWIRASGVVRGAEPSPHPQISLTEVSRRVNLGQLVFVSSRWV